jgi:hypothetical protein
MAHVHLRIAAELGQSRVGPEVADIEHRELLPAQPPAERDLEHRLVPPRLQRPFSAARAGAGDAFVARGEERLELVDAQRSAPRVALELVQVGDQVALVKQLAGCAAELALADHRPWVPPVAHVLREALQPPLIGAQRRARQPLRPR